MRRLLLIVLLLIAISAPGEARAPPRGVAFLMVNEETGDCGWSGTELTAGGSWGTVPIRVEEVTRTEAIESACLKDVLNMGEDTYRCLSEAELLIEGCYPTVNACYGGEESARYPQGTCIDNADGHLGKYSTCEHYTYAYNLDGHWELLEAPSGKAFEDKEACEAVCHFTREEVIDYMTITPYGNCSQLSEQTCCQQLGFRDLNVLYYQQRAKERKTTTAIVIIILVAALAVLLYIKRRRARGKDQGPGLTPPAP